MKELLEDLQERIEIGLQYDTISGGTANDLVELVTKLQALNIACVSVSLLSVQYLMELHTDLSYDDAVSLLKFCFDHTIKRKECYGHGSIMYPKFRESNER